MQLLYVTTFSECLDPWRVFAFAFLFFFFFFSIRFLLFETNDTIHHCSQDPQPLYLKKNIKNGPHSTISILKNYFVTVFSVFSFNKNKLYQNRPLSPLYNVVTNYFHNWRDKLLNHIWEIFEETLVTVQATSLPLSSVRFFAHSMCPFE